MNTNKALIEKLASEIPKNAYVHRYVATQEAEVARLAEARAIIADLTGEMILVEGRWIDYGVKMWGVTLMWDRGILGNEEILSQLEVRAITSGTLNERKEAAKRVAALILKRLEAETNE